MALAATDMPFRQTIFPRIFRREAVARPSFSELADCDRRRRAALADLIEGCPDALATEAGLHALMSCAPRHF